MPDRRIPKLSLHKATGLAVVRLNGADRYLGRHGTPEAQESYHRLIAEWLANNCMPLSSGAADLTKASLSVDELILAFWKHAESHYRHADGSPTSELHNYRLSLRPLRKLYGRLPAAEFSPLKLKAVRQEMIAARWCRPQINARVNRIRRMFKWAVSEELVSEAVFRALGSVQGLLKGRCPNVLELEPVQPVSDEDVAAVLPYLRPQIRAMVELQRLTGMRPGEVCQLRPRDLDTTGTPFGHPKNDKVVPTIAAPPNVVWRYHPPCHKTGWRGKSRVILMGPKAQAVLRPFLESRDPAAFVFSPNDAVEALHAERKSRRKTPLTPSQRTRKRKTNPKRKPHSRYNVTSYGRAIARACARAGVPVWSPNQLRHAYATEVRRQFGLEAAQVLLGHSRADVTQLYAERNLALAERVAAQMG